MIKKIAHLIVDFQIRNELLPDKKKNIYLYAYQLMISRGISFLFLLIISLVMGTVKEMLLFTIFFILLREYAGGFHLRNPELCILFSAALISGICLFIKSTEYVNVTPNLMLLEILSVIIIWICCPVDTDNKRLDEKEKSVYKMRSRRILVFELSIWIFCLFMQNKIGQAVIPMVHIVIAAGLVMELARDSLFFRK